MKLNERKRLAVLTILCIIFALSLFGLTYAASDENQQFHVSYENISQEEFESIVSGNIQDGTIIGSDYNQNFFYLRVQNYFGQSDQGPGYSGLLYKQPEYEITGLFINDTEYKIIKDTWGRNVNSGYYVTNTDSMSVEGVSSPISNEPVLQRNASYYAIEFYNIQSERDIDIRLVFAGKTPNYSPAEIKTSDESSGDISGEFQKNLANSTLWKLKAQPAAGYRLNYVEDSSGNQYKSADGLTVDIYADNDEESYTAFFREEVSPIIKISASNYGTCPNSIQWVQCGADFIESDVEDAYDIVFFLTDKPEGTLNDAIFIGDTVKVSDVPGARYYKEYRDEKLDSGFLTRDLAPGTYYIGAQVSTHAKDYYAYTPFTVYPDEKAYIHAGIDKIITSYINNWYIVDGEYVGLDEFTDFYGQEWEAWIFTALGKDYLTEDGTAISFDINDDFLHPDKEVLNWVEQRENRYKEMAERKASGETIKPAGQKTLFKDVAAICACGKDVRNFGGYNLVEDLVAYGYNSDGTSAISADGVYQFPDWCNIRDDLGTSYLFLALEIAGATPEEGYTSEMRRSQIKKQVDWISGCSENKGISDSFSMSLMALRFFENDIMYGKQCKDALSKYVRMVAGHNIGINGAMTWNPSESEDISKIWKGNNADSSAVAINTLVLAGLSAEDLNTGGFQKEYGSLLTCLCGEIVEDGVLYGSPNRMATYQTLGALVDLYNGKSCFEIAHEKYQQNYPQYFTDNYGKLPITSVSAIADQKYTGKPITPKISVVGEKYGRSANSEGVLKKNVDYTVEYKNNIKLGKATVTVTGIGDYYGTKEVTFNIVKSEKPTVVKKTQPMTVKAVTKKVSYKKLKKKKQIAKKALVVKKNQGKVTYKKLKGSSSKLTINAKNGNITVKKKTKKGTYKIKVKVTAAGNAKYKAGSKTVTVKIKVK